MPYTYEQLSTMEWVRKFEKDVANAENSLAMIRFDALKACFKEGDIVQSRNYKCRIISIHDHTYPHAKGPVMIIEEGIDATKYGGGPLKRAVSFLECTYMTSIETGELIMPATGGTDAKAG